MTVYRGLTKKTFHEKMDYLEVPKSASCKLLQVTDDATFYTNVALATTALTGSLTVSKSATITQNLAVSENLAVSGMATVTGTFVASNTTDLNGCLLGNVRTSTSGMETTAYNDFILLMKGGTSGFQLTTVTLSTEYVTSGRMIYIKDISGYAGSANTAVRVVAETGGTLNNVTSAVTLRANYGAMLVISDGTSCWALHQYY